MRQNLWLSTVYNLIAVPIAVLAMSPPADRGGGECRARPVIVTLNAMRARSAGRGALANTASGFRSRQIHRRRR